MRDFESAGIVRSPDPIEQPVLRLALLTLGDPNQQTGGHRYHRKMARAAPGYGAEIRFCSISDRSWPLPIATAARAFRAASERSDAIVLDSLAAAFVAPWIARSPVPVIAVLHQAPGGVGQGWIRSLSLGALDRLAYRHASGFIAAGQSLVDTLRGLRVPNDRIRLVPPGCDVPLDEGPPLDLRQGRDVAVLCVANWTPNKGIVELLNAFASLPESAATLWLVGATDVDRAYAERVRRRISAPDLSRRVVVRGALPFDEVGRMYRSADVFALCSVVDAYGTAWAEAISAGLPVVGWRTANLPRLAEHGREALMPEPGDHRGLASALQAISTDAGLRERLSAGARRRARTLPTWRESEESFFFAVREFLEAAGQARRPSGYRSS
ncbi:MAG: glycosyltransferase family 4 protein [Actinomycetota bacterium]|nr:glycosyltransferase family 4 protein [Actinomycetota bacterium]